MGKAKGIKRLIQLCVLFVCLVLIWSIFGIIIYFNPQLWGKIGMPVLPPRVIFVPLYAILSKLSEWLTIIIIIVILMLWLIDKIVRKIFPKFLRKMIGWEWSPWKELRAVGIFALIDAILTSIFSDKSLERRIGDVVIALQRVVVSSMELLGKELNGFLGINTDVNISFSTPQEVDSANDPSPITDEKQAEINDSFTRCVEEKILIEKPGMSNTDLLKIKVTNQNIKVQCKLEQMRNNMNLISGRM